MDGRFFVRLDRHRIRFWRQARQPMVLDEDGTLRVPVIAPGEIVQVVVDDQGHTRAARVLRPNGTVRLESDWSTR